MLLKVSDNYSASIVGNFSDSATTITVDVAPVKTAGYLTAFDLDGNQFEKIKYTGVSGLDLTGCVRGLSFDDNSDTPVVGNAKDLKNGMAIKMTVTQHYLNPVVDFVNQYDGKWESPVANYSALLLLTGMSDSEARVTIDDGAIYVYNLATLTWIKQTPGSTSTYLTELLGSDGTGTGSKTFTLLSGSFADKKYFQVLMNGILLREGSGNDYTVFNNNACVLEYAIDATDKITLKVIQ